MNKVIEELLIFSDLHSHNFKYGSKRIEYEGATFNSRLIDTIHVLDEIKDYALAHNIETLLFGGDLLHRRQSYTTDVFNLVFRKFEEFSDEGLTVLMIPGNHDHADRAGLVHALAPFESIENVRVASTPSCMWTSMCAVHCVPYTPDLSDAKSALILSGQRAQEYNMPNILLAHLGMQGARVGSDYVLVTDGDIKVADVPYESFTACFFGHYHEHQQLFRNGWYIGATHEHNWGDSGGTRGFLHARVYSDKVDFTHIQTDAPRFIVMDGEAQDFRDKDFVKVRVDVASQSIRRRLETQLGRTNFELQTRLDKPEIVLTLKPSQLDPESAMDAWVEANPPDELKPSVVLDEGRAVLREVVGGAL